METRLWKTKLQTTGSRLETASIVCLSVKGFFNQNCGVIWHWISDKWKIVWNESFLDVFTQRFASSLLLGPVIISVPVKRMACPLFQLAGHFPFASDRQDLGNFYASWIFDNRLVKAHVTLLLPGCRVSPEFTWTFVIILRGYLGHPTPASRSRSTVRASSDEWPSHPTAPDSIALPCWLRQSPGVAVSALGWVRCQTLCLLKMDRLWDLVQWPWDTSGISQGWQTGPESTPTWLQESRKGPPR